MKQIVLTFLLANLFILAQAQTNFSLLKDIHPFTSSVPRANTANNTNNISFNESYII